MQSLASRTVMAENYPDSGPGSHDSRQSDSRPGALRQNVLPDVTTLSSELRDQFVAQNLRRIFRQIYRLVGNVHDAQDLTQEAFIKALQRQEQLKDLEK